MFGKLKSKLKEWTQKVADLDEDELEIIQEETKEQDTKKETEEIKKTEKKSFFKKIFSKKETEEIEEIKTPKEEIQEESDFVTETEDKALKEKSQKKNKEKEKKSEDANDKKEKLIDESLKKEAQKEKYIEPIQEFEIGLQKTSPDIEKTIQEIETKKTPLETEKKKSFFSKLISSKKTITEEEFDEHAEDLEMILLENNVALEVVDKILKEIKEQIIGIELSKKEIIDKITETLSEKIKEVLQEPFDIEKEIKEKKGPYIILFCGINGTGKTTTISKIANMFKEKGKSVVMAAGDTFRAAAVEQLKTHGEKLGIKVISHDYGADPASVGFDAIKYAEKNNIDIVLIDTAGRIHTATNLIREMEKIKRVCKPDRTLFVGESITGNDAVDQVKAFNDNIGIDGIVLSKADIDEKGGTALSVGYITKKPIIFLGTGQNYKDIEKFNKEKFLKKLDLE